MKKIKLALLILGISVFASCSGDAVENTAASEATNAKLTVVVRDAITGDLIDEAEATLLSSEPVLSKDGIVSFNDVRIGANILKIEKPGYASMSEEVEIGVNFIEVNSTKGEYAFTARESSIMVDLSPENADLYGYLYYTNAKGQELPAEGVKVYIELSELFVKRLFETQTDASGKYSFNSLPAGTPPFRVWAAAPEGGLGGIKFESFGGKSDPLPSGTTYMGKEVLTQEQNNANFEASYNSTVAKDGNIVFTFTESIDQSSVEIGRTVKVNPSQATLKWESNKLTISPLHEWERDIEVIFDNLKSSSGKIFSTRVRVDNRFWNLRGWDPDDYGVSTCAELLDLLNSRGYRLLDWRESEYYYGCDFTRDDYTYQTHANFTIAITLRLADLSGAAVDGLAAIAPTGKFNYNATSANLRWNLVEGATSYVIYRKNDASSSYMRVSEVPAIPGSTIGSENNVDLGDELLGRTVSFIVQAKNETSISPLDPSKAVSVKDEVKPVSVSTHLEGCLAFSEPINKNTLSVSQPANAPQGNLYGDIMTICVNPEEPVEVPTVYTISGIKDLYGNLYGTEGKATITINPY